MATRHMVYMLIGAVSGLVLGLVVLLVVFRVWGETFQDQGLVVLLVVGVCVIGGLTGGAYTVQAIVYRLNKRKKKEEREAKKKKRRR